MTKSMQTLCERLRFPTDELLRGRQLCRVLSSASASSMMGNALLQLMMSPMEYAGMQAEEGLSYMSGSRAP